MKKLLTLVIMCAAVMTTLAQSVTYQSVIRDANQQLVTNAQTNTTIKISFADGKVFQQEYQQSTNIHGLLTIEMSDTCFENHSWKNATMDVTVKNANNTVTYISSVNRPVGASPYALSVNGKAIQQYLDQNNYISGDSVRTMLADSLSDLREELSGPSEDLSDLTRRLDSIGNVVYNLVSDTAWVHTNIRELLSDTAWTYSNIRTLLADTTNVHSQLRGLAADTANVHSQLRGLASDTAWVHNNIRELLSDTAWTYSNIRTLLADTANVHSQLRGLAADTANVHSQLRGLAADTAFVHSQLRGLASDTAFVHQYLRDLDSNKASKTDLTALETRVATNETDIDNLETSKADKSDLSDSTITVQFNGTTVGTFTLNQMSNKTLNIVLKEQNDYITLGADETGDTQAMTLSQTPNANFIVKMYINGVLVGDNSRTSDNVITVSGTTATYHSASNNNYKLKTTDRIQVVYLY